MPPNAVSSPPAPVDDFEILVLLVGNEEERQAGERILQATYQRRLQRFVEWNWPICSPGEAQALVESTLGAFSHGVRSGAIDDRESIAKALIRLAKQSFRECILGVAPNSDLKLTPRGAGSDLAFDWALLEMDGLSGELYRRVLAFATGLSDLHTQILGVMSKGDPPLDKNAFLAEVRKRINRHITTVEILEAHAQLVDGVHQIVRDLRAKKPHERTRQRF